MPRPKLITPSSPINIHLDSTLKARLDALLYSELESRVPYGAYQRFFNLILTQALSDRRLDLAPFLNTQPGTTFVRGDPNTIALLRAHLEQPK